MIEIVILPLELVLSTRNYATLNRYLMGTIFCVPLFVLLLNLQGTFLTLLLQRVHRSLRVAVRPPAPARLRVFDGGAGRVRACRRGPGAVHEQRRPWRGRGGWQEDLHGQLRGAEEGTPKPHEEHPGRDLVGGALSRLLLWHWCMLS